MDSVGLPLDVVVDFLDTRGFMMDWLDFYSEAVKKGWPPDRTMLRLTQVVGDVYGPRFREDWVKRMQEAINHLNRNNGPIV